MFLTVLGVVILFFVLIGLIKVGVKARYSEEGFSLKIVFGLLRIRILPRRRKDPSAKNSKSKTKKKKEKVYTEEKQKKGGTVQKIKELLPLITETLGRFRRKLEVDVVKVYFSAASVDPFKAAMSFGYSSAAMGTVNALIHRFLNVKSLDLRSNVDFEAKEPTVFAEAQLTIRIGQAVNIAIRFLISYLKLDKSSKMKDNKEKPSELQKGR